MNAMRKQLREQTAILCSAYAFWNLHALAMIEERVSSAEVARAVCGDDHRPYSLISLLGSKCFKRGSYTDHEMAMLYAEAECLLRTGWTP